jgi:metal-responsive CopG/Arc/MetJ family transcriptional regulator
MTTEMINLKLDSKFLNEIDSIVKTENYQNRTEFIREVLRKGVDEAKMKKIMEQLAPFRGASKRKTTDEELHKTREKIFSQLEKKYSGL